MTTAATLWFVTVLGLCFGGGELALGLAGLALGILVLGGLKRVENRWKQDRHAAMSPLFSFSEWSNMRTQSLPFAYLAS
jgi:putative Mg2+ transporter-C (MgtC) family protein